MTEEARRRERAAPATGSTRPTSARGKPSAAPLQRADYARLIVATERSGAAAALDSLAIRRTVWVRMKRLWARRLADDPRLRARVEAEIARLREAPRQPSESNAPAAQAGFDAIRCQMCGSHDGDAPS